MKFKSDVYKITQTDSGCILYPIDELKSSKMILLNNSSWIVLKSYCNGLAVDDVAEDYAQRFGISEDLARADVAYCLKELAENGVIEDV